MQTFFDVGSEEAVEGPDFRLKRSHAYQARKVHEPEAKKKTKSGKEGGGMVEVGRRREVANPPKPIVGSKRSYPGTKLTPTQKMGAAGCGGGLGGTGERAHPTRCPARRGHNRKGTKPQEGSDGKPIGMLRWWGVATVASRRCLQGRGGVA